MQKRDLRDWEDLRDLFLGAPLKMLATSQAFGRTKPVSSEVCAEDPSQDARATLHAPSFVVVRGPSCEMKHPKGWIVDTLKLAVLVLLAAVLIGLLFVARIIKF